MKMFKIIISTRIISKMTFIINTQNRGHHIMHTAISNKRILIFKNNCKDKTLRSKRQLKIKE